MDQVVEEDLGPLVKVSQRVVFLAWCLKWDDRQLGKKEEAMV